MDVCMDTFVAAGLFLATLPYKIAIASALSVGVLSIPLIFEVNTVLWFNEAFVTTGGWKVLHLIDLIDLRIS